MDRYTERKVFDETKTGVKGLVDSGIKEIPAMFHAPSTILESLKAPTSKQTIPIIDLKGGDRRIVVEKMGEAAEKWGFFQVKNHGIPEDVMERMLEGVRRFHELELERKKQFYSREHHARDFLHSTNIDILTSVAASWRDSFFCYVAPDPPRPEDVPDFLREILMEYSKQVMKLGELIFELLSEALGLSSNHLKDLNCAKSLVMGGQYYPPCPQPDLTVGIHKHADFSSITILLQGSIGGLQVLHEDSWIDAPPVPGALTVNIGDILQLLTNDKFISAEHRVIAHGHSIARVSVPSFFTTYLRSNPQVYEPIKELLSEDNPPKYRECSGNELVDGFGSKEIAACRLLPFRI